jgi:acetyltransferase
MDINPLIVDEHGAVAVDARIVIAAAMPPADASQARRFDPNAHLAILPYPTRYEQEWPLRGGGSWTLRPIHPGDAAMLQDFVQRLSPESRYFRFVSHFKELPLGMLARFTLIDYDREMALVAVVDDEAAGSGARRIVGVSRYITNPDRTSCEFSLVVADDFKGRGLGSRLMESIMDVAREQGLATMEGLVLTRNAVMLELVRRLGFAVRRFEQDADFYLVSRAL